MPGAAALRLPFWRLAGAILLFSTLFNLLTAHVGETELAVLPDGWWLIGGPLTLEAAVYGFITGLSLMTLLSLFLAFNAIVPTTELAGLTPAALYELGLVLLVATPTCRRRRGSSSASARRRRFVAIACAGYVTGGRLPSRCWSAGWSGR